ncbi:MAG TPA: PIN domain-containing protein [Micromonosporaceae bacterium]|nr:PIN domain-containing protein [Micromonosporaceae bacterium]
MGWSPSSTWRPFAGRPDTPSLVYLDSCAFLYVINKTTGYEPVADLLHVAESGKVTIMMSPLTLVEVIGKPKDKPLDPATDSRVRRLLDNPRFLVVEFDRTVALKARTFVGALGLKPADAIHMASAVVGRADVLMTFDTKFPLGKRVDGVWVDIPYQYGGETLFSMAQED